MNLVYVDLQKKNNSLFLKLTTDMFLSKSISCIWNGIRVLTFPKMMQNGCTFLYDAPFCKII